MFQKYIWFAPPVIDFRWPKNAMRRITSTPPASRARLPTCHVWRFGFKNKIRVTQTFFFKDPGAPTGKGNSWRFVHLDMYIHIFKWKFKKFLPKLKWSFSLWSSAPRRKRKRNGTSGLDLGSDSEWIMGSLIHSILV